MDKDNVQILRDLSLLQIQIRDYEGYKVRPFHGTVDNLHRKAVIICFAFVPRKS